mgnify:CR=1 FL=1
MEYVIMFLLGVLGAMFLIFITYALLDGLIEMYFQLKYKINHWRHRMSK